MAGVLSSPSPIKPTRTEAPARVAARATLASAPGAWMNTPFATGVAVMVAARLPAVSDMISAPPPSVEVNFTWVFSFAMKTSPESSIE